MHAIHIELHLSTLRASTCSFSLPQDAEIFGKQIANSTIVTGQFGEVRGYLVYTFFVVNGENNIGYLTIVDSGNGKVLYTSQSLP
jgi:hypothetical protein